MLAAPPEIRTLTASQPLHGRRFRPQGWKPTNISSSRREEGMWTQDEQVGGAFRPTQECDQRSMYVSSHRVSVQHPTRTKMSASGKHEFLCILVLITQSDRGTPKCGGTEEHRQTKHPEETSRPQFGLTFTFHAPPSPELVDPNWCRTFHRMTTRDACNIYVVQASPAFAVKPEPTPCNTPRQSDSSTFRGRACCSLQNNRHHVTCY